MSRLTSAQFPAGLVLFCIVLFLHAAPDVGGLQAAEKSPAASAAPADTHPVLVELFTSEGCSSCPPADALIERMDTSQPVPGAQLIVLSEHVDYWDHDGWKDPNSSAALTQRQADYVRVLGLKTAYTPQMVVDGTEELRANNAQEVSKVFHDVLPVPKVPVRIGELSVGGNPSVLQTRIEADGETEKHDADVYVAIALDRVESQVLHGENGGRHLTHVAVVRQLVKVGKLSKGKSFGETVRLKLDPGMDGKNIRVIAFVQESGPGKVVGAAVRKSAS